MKQRRQINQNIFIFRNIMRRIFKDAWRLKKLSHYTVPSWGNTMKILQRRLINAITTWHGAVSR